MLPSRLARAFWRRAPRASANHPFETRPLLRSASACEPPRMKFAAPRRRSARARLPGGRLIPVRTRCDSRGPKVPSAEPRRASRRAFHRRGFRSRTHIRCAGAVRRVGGHPWLFLGERSVSFDPYAVLDGRRFLAMLRISEAARCLGLPSLFAHLCKQAIERGEHRLVVASDGALLGGGFGVRFTFGIAGGIHGGGHPADHLQNGRAPYWGR